MRSARLLASALALSLIACGGGRTAAELHTDGLDKLSAGEFDAAVASLEQAMGLATDDATLAVQIEKDLAEARIHTDPALAAEDFMALAAEHSEAVGETDYLNFGRQLKDAGQLNAAITVIDSGLKRYGETESPKLREMMGQIVQAVTSGGDSAEAERLKSLGYIGD